MGDAVATSIDAEEVARFSAMAAEWWDPKGKFRPLHKFNPVRLNYIKRHVCAHFGLDFADARAFENLQLLDIGCGGGLLCEPTTRLGATVTGIDPSERNIGIASAHAKQSGLDITYLATSAEAMAESGKQFNIVLNMEVVEHVADVEAFIKTSASLVNPGGLMFVATLNRTFKAFALAIVGAEYVLRWLPRGTHQWEKFVTPQELGNALDAGGMTTLERTGVSFNPLTDVWRETHDMDVNYLVVATR